METKIVIIGAGLVGPLLSTYLSKLGFDVSIYEKRSDPRKNTINGGRSINLALSDRGWKALEEIGVADEAKKIAIPMSGRIVHDIESNTDHQPYGKEGQCIYSISREKLNNLLINHAKESGVQVFFDECCTHIDFNNRTLFFESNQKVKADFFIGADGAFSNLRGLLDQKEEHTTISTLTHGYVELTIPPDSSGKYALENNGLHIWPRKDFMLIALPNMDKSFTCTLFLPMSGEYSFESLKTKNQVSSFFEKYFPSVVSHLNDIEINFFRKGPSKLDTITCEKWYSDRVLLIGDAAHAIVPFYGQGMNAGFEDCSLLYEDLKNRKESSVEGIFKSFQSRRKKDTDAIAQLALRNFVEMRDLVLDKNFLLKKEIDTYLHNKFHEQWLPLYTMVTFTHMPYAKVLEAGERQDAILNRILELPNIFEEWRTLDYRVYLD